MAKILSKTGITTTSTVQAGHVSQSIDAFAGIKAYDISLSGSFHMTGSITGQPGVINNLTASYAMSASVEITKEVSSSFADLAAGLTLTPTISVANIVASGSGGVAIIVSGSIIPEGSGTHNLGSLTNPFKELFISDNSLKLVSSSINASGAQQTTGSLSVTLDSNGILALDGVYTGSFDGKYKGNGDLITSLKGVNPLQVTGSNAFSILSGITTIGGDSSAANIGEGATTIKGATLAITSTATTITSALNINNAPVTNITASGNISSSGDIFANNLTLIGDFTSTSATAQFTNITASGNISSSGIGTFASLDISGDIDVDGTTNLDVVDIDGAVDMASTLVIASHITASGNISGSGTGSFGAIQMNDTNVLSFGDSQDLAIYHDGSNSYIEDVGTGQLKIIGGTAVNILSPNDESMGVFTANGGVDLYFNDTKKFETQIGGVNVTGAITASGDISSSGTVTAAAAVLTTADINGGTVDGITSLTAGGDLDIGAHKLRAETFQSDIATGTAPFTVASTTTVTNLEAATVATIAGLAPNTATTQATQASITTAANLTTVGALNAGSITSGFTSIDVGAGAITTTGTISAGIINASGNISASQVFDGTYYQWEVSVLADTDDDTNWQGPPTTGLIGAVNWSKDFGTVYDGIADIVQTRTNINTGWRIPHGANYSASIKSIDVYVGGGTNATIDASDHLSASLWYSTATDVNERLNQSGTTGITQRHGGTAITTQTGQTLVKFNNYLISQSINVDLAPGAMLWPRVKMAEGSSQNLLWNIYYIVNYCKKPL